MKTLLALLVVTQLAYAGAESSYAAAKAAYDAKDFPTAATQYELFVTTFPDDPRVVTAGNLWLDSLNRTQPLDVKRFLEAVEKLRANKHFVGDDRARLDKIHAQILAQRAQDVPKDHPLDAAALFEEAAGLSPDKDELLFNAAVMYALGRDFKKSNAMFHASATSTKQPRLAMKAWIMAARNEEDFEPEAAAADYLLGSQAKERDAADARYNAALLTLATGNPKKALEIMVSYGKDFGAMPGTSADENALAIGHIAVVAGDDAKAIAAFDAYVHRKSPPELARGYLELGKALAHQGNEVKAKAAFANAIKAGKQASIVAEAKFQLSEQLARESSAVSLAVPTNKLVAALKERVRLVEAALAAYQDVKDPQWTIAALDRAAHVYDDYASALLAANAPANLSQAEKATYRRTLETFASGVTNKTIDNYRAAYDTALATNIHSEYAIDAHRQLARFDAKQYPVEREARSAREPAPGYVDLKP